MTAPTLTDGDALWSSLGALGTIGSYVDDRTGLHGVNRLALTEADAEGRRMVIKWLKAEGLSVRTDRVGNVYARRSGSGADPRPVICGSHLDSVATGGAFDGALGVLAGIQVVRTLNRLGVRTERPIDVAIFTEEEGVRFGTDMLGSAVAAGRIGVGHALALADETGVTVEDELNRTGFAGEGDPVLTEPYAYIECHIEQGPILAAAGVDLGVVTGVQAISWHDVSIIGRSAHAGTTPMELRRDAGLAMARVNVKIHEMVAGHDFGDLRATMGRAQVHPNLTNIVPASARCTVDLRNPNEGQMRRAEAELLDFLQRLGTELGVEITADQTARTAPVPFAEEVQSIIAEEITAIGRSRQPILSGAGHDAQELATICPSGMIFVPGQYDGISHNPRELSTAEACADGLEVLYRAVCRLAGAK